MSTTDDFTDVVNQAVNRYQSYRRQAQALSAQQANALDSIAGTWPQLNPGLALSLGKAGLTGDHPTVQQAAVSAAKQKAAQGGLANVGQQVTGQQVKKHHNSILGSIGSFLGLGSPVSAASSVSNIAVNHPSVGNALDAVGRPIAAAGGAISSNQTVKDVYSGVKGATRLGTAALELPADLIQGAYRGMRLAQGQTAAGEAPSWNDLINQTQIGSIIEQGVTTGDTGGAGFFFNSKSKAGQAQGQAARSFGTVGGHALTVGRGTAAVVTEPGTRPYNILSGLLDFGVQLEGGKPAAELGKAIRGRNVLAGNEGEYVVNAEGKAVPAASYVPSAVSPTEIAMARRAGVPSSVTFGQQPGTLSLLRHHPPGEDLNAAGSRPTGTYYHIQEPGAATGAFKGSARVTSSRTGSSIGALEITGSEADDAGHAALRHLAGEPEFQRIDQLDAQDPGALRAEIVSRFGVTPGAHDDLLDVYGAQLAKEAGYKAVIFRGGQRREYLDLGGGTNATPNVARLGTDYGLVDGLRKTVLPEKAVTWLNSKAGNRFAQFAADTGSFNQIWDSTGRKLPVDVVTALVDAKDPVAVKQILAGELGSTLRQAPKVSSAQAIAASGGTPGVIGQAGLTVRKARQSPIFALMPHQSLDLTNPDRAVEDFDRFQRITKAFTPEQISANNAKLAKALGGQGGEAAALQAVLHVTDVVGQTLKSLGVDAVTANRAVRSWRNTVNDLRHFNINDIGDNVDFPGVQHGDDMTAAPSPHLFVEYLNNNIPLPDVRDIRTAVSKLRNITDSAPAHLVQDASDFINNNIFKPWALLRGAWPIRVLGEEQARMGAAGYSSFLHDPASYIALITGSKMPRTSALLQKMGKDALTMDVKGTKWQELADEAFSGDANEFAQAMSHRAAGYVDPSNGILTRHFPLFTKGVDPGYHLAWVDELRKLNIDPVSRRIAQALDDNVAAPRAVSDTTDWLWSGSGQSIRNTLGARWAAAQARRLLPANNNPFGDRQQLESYVQSIYDRIETKTGAHPQLVNAVATGKIVGKKLVRGGDANPDAASALDQFSDYGPKVVTGPMRVFTKSNPSGAKVAAAYKSFVNMGFDLLMSKPSNGLSRSPVFRQAYYRRISELAPYMDAKAAAKAAKNAEEASASKAAQALRAGGKGKLTLDSADTIAKKYALDQVSELLYGESKRSSFFDATRILFPFGDAYREVVTRWAKLASQNPAVPLRTAQIVNGARESGFTYTDPQTGKESFVYPGSTQLTQLLTGVPVPLTAQASGLNMVSAQLLPGFGPAVQIAAGQLIPDVPATQNLRNFLMPYGPGDTSGGVFDQISSTFIPAWLRKLQTTFSAATPAQQRALMATTNQVMAYLYSTGDYDLSTPDGQQKLVADAKNKAKAIWRIRGMAQFGAPAAPEPEVSVKDKAGQLHTIYALQNAYRTMQDKDPANATADFMDTYGPLALMATNPTTSGNFAPTTSLYDFVQNNPDLVKKYPTLYGFFAPAGGQFSQPEYQREIASGQRVGVSPSQDVAITQQRMATAIYNHLKEQVAGRTDAAAREWLSNAREKLAQQYPQFISTYPAPDQGTTQQQVQRLQAAAVDPQVLKTEAGQGLALYLAARDKAMQAAKAGGLASFATAKSAAGIRSWLQGVAAQITTAYPDFQTLYQQVFAHETDGAQQ